MENLIISVILMTLMCDSSDVVMRNYMLVTVRGQKFKGYLIYKKMCNT